MYTQFTVSTGVVKKSKSSFNQQQ